MADAKVDVSSFLLLKNMYDDSEGGLFLSGTIIQTVFDEEKKMDVKEKHFPYSINEKKDYHSVRRSTINKDGNRRTTFELDAKMEKSIKFDTFPFRIISASATIELKSSTTGGNVTLRPNLLVNKKSKNMTQMQRSGKIKGNDPIEAIREKMDQSLNYNFITPFPKIRYQHDKDYCSKFKVTFYMLESSSYSKLVQIIFPMLLIAILNTINVINADESEFIGNASTFALTAVFILPTIIGQAKTQHIFTPNNVYIMLVFIGLALSSISETLAGTKILKLLGMIILWLSFLIPAGGYVLFYKEYSRILSKAPKPSDRMCESNAKKSEIGNRAKLIRVRDILKLNEDVPEIWDGDVENEASDFESSLYTCKTSEDDNGIITVYGW